MSNHIVLRTAEATEQLPVSPFIAGGEDVAVGSTEVQPADVIGVCGERDDGSARWPNLVPSLRLSAED